MNAIKIGSKAPDFSLTALDGGTVSLSSFSGTKVLVAFLRNAKCAICNLWVHRMARGSAALKEKGLQVIAVFESAPEALKAQFEGRDPGFPVLADPDGTVHELFSSVNDPTRVQDIITDGLADAALKEAAKQGFAPTMEEGANFFRIPSEVLIDGDGTVRAIHRSDAIFNHMSHSDIERFLAN